MTRHFIILPICAALAACAGPIETRIANSGFQQTQGAMQYSFASEPEQENPVYSAAQEAVKSELADKGYMNSQDAPTLVEIALSDRPADIGISIGGKEQEKNIVPPKKRKLLQSCADREYRIKIYITSRVSGETIYHGQASEYHCKAGLEEVLPYLVRASLSDLGTARVSNRTEIRQGKE